MNVRRLGLAVAVGLLALPTIAVAGASYGPTATSVRMGDHPGYVRVVVDFTGTVWPDHFVFDHLWTKKARMHFEHPNYLTWTSGGAGQGVHVRLQPEPEGLQLFMDYAPYRFKYASYSVVGGNRLAIDLWKSAPPSTSPRVRAFPRGCLTLQKWTITPGSVSAHGTEHGVFEHQFQVVVRGANGKVLGRQTGVHGPHWSTTVPYRATHRQAGTLEAAAFSPKDGALSCIAQTRVTLPTT
jgi:Immunoglobulin-like domain of bacterial spore germination